MPRKDEATTQPEELYPDMIEGEAVYRWTGHMNFTRTKKRSAVLLVEQGQTIRKQMLEEDDGTEEIPFPGGCLICGVPTYAWHSGPHADHVIGNQLAVFAPAGRNEPPMVYCQKHDPGKDHRSKSGRLRPDEVEGAVVRILK